MEPVGARSRWETALLIAWALLALGIALRLAFASDPARQNVYLKEFVPAAEAFWRGADLYPPPGEASLVGKGFRYPPLCAALLWPFAACGPVLGSVLWRLLNIGVLLLGLRALWRAPLPWPLANRERALLLALAAVCGLPGLNNGQANGLMLGGLLLATTGTLAGRTAGPAAWIAIATVVKVYPLAFGFVLATLRPRLWWGLALGVAVGALLPFALADAHYVVDQYRKLATLLADEDRTHDLGNAYRDVRLLAAVLGVWTPGVVFLALQALGGLAIVLGARRLRARAGDGAAWTFACHATLCWCLLLGPATEKATYQLLAPPLAWSLTTAWRERARPRLAIGIAASLLVLLDAVLPSMRDLPWLRTFLPWAALLVAVDLAATAVRARPAAS